MVLPLWRSLHSINLMLPKEERRAMLLRIFNDSTPVNNNSMKNQKAPRVQAETPIDTPMETPAETSVEPSVEPPVAIEEDALKKENLALGQDEQEQVDTRETYTKAGDEEDRFNTTV